MSDVDPARRRCVAAVLRRGDRVLLGRRAASREWYPGVWDLPGGHVEAGEAAHAAAARELVEELGVTVGHPPAVPDVVLVDHDVDLAVWVIDRWTGEPSNLAPDEHDELRWCSVDDLAQLPLALDGYRELLTDLLASPGRVG